MTSSKIRTRYKIKNTNFPRAEISLDANEVTNRKIAKIGLTIATKANTTAGVPRMPLM